MRRGALLMLGGALTCAGVARAQHEHHMPMPPVSQAPASPSHPGMDQDQPPAAEARVDAAAIPRSGCPSGDIIANSAEGDMPLQGEACVSSTQGSGTSLLPGAELAMHGLHVMSSAWMLMAHGYAWGVYSDQGGPRGDAQASVLSMAMLQAERRLGSDGARLQLRTMLSLDPLMGACGYPLLLASGETAGGAPLVDRQHPHDFVMELSARVDLPFGRGVTGFVYGGPVAEPALGPSAFMHRGSARYNPEAPIGHHWFDSTHISFGVVTAGLRTGRLQLEASAFRGREPDESRWDIETPRLDSWSVRGSWTPSPHWAAQVSFGRLESPEALHPSEDEERLTASVHYARRGLSVTGAFAAKNRLPGPTLAAWLLEANWNLGAHHSLFGRAERVDNDELLPAADPHHGTVYRVSRATIGYAYRVPLGGLLRLAVGGSGSIHFLPDALRMDYGRTPLAFTLFAKLSLGD
jgi:hypothetical protein